MFKWLRKNKQEEPKSEFAKSERQIIVDDIMGVDGMNPDDFIRLAESLIKLRRILINKNIPEFKTKLIGFDISIKEYV